MQSRNGDVIMCTVSVKVDEALIREVLPELDNTTAIRLWAQMLIDEHLKSLSEDKYIFQHDMTVEELYGAISNEIDSIYAKG